jgi:hypothetical protein
MPVVMSGDSVRALHAFQTYQLPVRVMLNLGFEAPNNQIGFSRELVGADRWLNMRMSARKRIGCARHCNYLKAGRRVPCVLKWQPLKPVVGWSTLRTKCFGSVHVGASTAAFGADHRYGRFCSPNA